MIDDDRETDGLPVVRFRGRVVQVRARYMTLCNATSQTWQPVKFATAGTRVNFLSSQFVEVMTEKEGGMHIHTYTQFRVTSHVASGFVEDPSFARSCIPLVICRR